MLEIVVNKLRRALTEVIDTLATVVATLVVGVVLVGGMLLNIIFLMFSLILSAVVLMGVGMLGLVRWLRNLNTNK